jgi:4-aminobutyrate aminotransferase
MISMGGTYGGNAVACAAACATIDVIEEEKLLENTVHRGEQLRAGLLKLKQKYSVISDVRGEGLMLAIEFNADYGFAGKVSKAALDHKMLLLTTSVFETIRIIPPLTVSKEEIELGLTLLDKSIAAALKNK